MEVEFLCDICDEVVDFAFNCTHDLAQGRIGVEMFGLLQDRIPQPGRVELEESVVAGTEAMAKDSRSGGSHSPKIRFSIQRKCREEKEQKPRNKREARALGGGQVPWDVLPESLYLASLVNVVQVF